LQHKEHGFYVEDLSMHVVDSVDQVLKFLVRRPFPLQLTARVRIERVQSLGASMRTIRATNMNDFSSRSHTVLMLHYVQARCGAQHES
jgi:hypothetical protein